MPYKKERIKTYITPQGDGNFNVLMLSPYSSK